MSDAISTATSSAGMNRVHSAAFRAFVAKLKADFDLSRIVKTWDEFSGDPKRNGLPESADQVPWVQFRPSPGASTRASCTHDVWNTSLSIGLKIAVPGSNWGDAADLWGVIEGLVMSRAFIVDMAEFGVMDIEIVQPAAALNDEGSAFATGEGAIRLVMMI